MRLRCSVADGRNRNDSRDSEVPGRALGCRNRGKVRWMAENRSPNLDDSDERRALLIAGERLMPRLREAFPEFESRWTEHLAFWDGGTAGAYNDIAPFSHFIVDELFIHGRHDEVRRAFLLMDELFLAGDQSTRDIIGMGFIEDIRNISSHRAGGHSALMPYLTPTLRAVWDEIARKWAAHSSLADVIRAERKTSVQDEDSLSPWQRLWRRIRSLYS